MVQREATTLECIAKAVMDESRVSCYLLTEGQNRRCFSHNSRDRGARALTLCSQKKKDQRISNLLLRRQKRPGKDKLH